MTKRVKEYSKEKIKIDIYPSDQIGYERKLIYSNTFKDKGLCCSLSGLLSDTIEKKEYVFSILSGKEYKLEPTVFLNKNLQSKKRRYYIK